MSVVDRPGGEGKRARSRRGSPFVLDVQDLVVQFETRAGLVRAVDGLSFRLLRGRTLALVGESGSGKSVTTLSILRLLPSPPARVVGGKILFGKHDLLALSEPALRSLRGAHIALIPQEPLAALDPVFPVGEQIAEVLRTHRAFPRRRARAAAVSMLERAGIPGAEARARAYPHELSGGMRQRVLLAVALACQPAILLADEPTTALDATLQTQVLALLRAFQREHGTSILFITHDLGVAAEIADEVAVLYAGRIVERASAPMLFARPAHPYTEALLRSLPSLSPPRTRLPAIEGSPPAPGEEISGCRFHPRCPRASARCTSEDPALRTLLWRGEARVVACHHAEEVLVS
jgi:oligopeptide/dipeptide ABC transporter ATP-binding protein